MTISLIQQHKRDMLRFSKYVSCLLINGSILTSVHSPPLPPRLCLTSTLCITPTTVDVKPKKEATTTVQGSGCMDLNTELLVCLFLMTLSLSGLRNPCVFKRN